MNMTEYEMDVDEWKFWGRDQVIAAIVYEFDLGEPAEYLLKEQCFPDKDPVREFYEKKTARPYRENEGHDLSFVKRLSSREVAQLLRACLKLRRERS